MRKHSLILVLVLAAFVLSTGAAYAGQATNALTVGASVAATCRIKSVTNIAFGAYDPTDATDLDAAGDYVFACTKNTAYDMYITGGRTMTDGTDTLNLELYSDAGRTTVFPSAAVGITGTAANNGNITQNVYGRVANGQNVQVGAYSGSVTITIDY